MEGQPGGSKSAVLIFADTLPRDLSRRGWSDRFAPLLSILKIESESIPGARIYLSTTIDRRPSVQGDLTLHRQTGRTFAERFEDAIEQVAQTGAERIVVVGRDCPQLESSDIRDALSALDSNRLVIGPDHRGGCWLIAFHAADIELLCGVVWQRNTDCDELLQRFGSDRTHLLDVKIDVDSTSDLPLLARVARSWSSLIESLCLTLNYVIEISPRTGLLHERRRWQMPPPIAA
jgi:glycosyltransferase A (GT-A) superfamily protein (DUF2064 family)